MGTAREGEAGVLKMIGNRGLAVCSILFRDARCWVGGATASVVEFHDVQSAVQSPQGRIARPTAARPSPTLAVAPQPRHETETQPPSLGRGDAEPIIFNTPASPSRVPLRRQFRKFTVLARKTVWC